MFLKVTYLNSTKGNDSPIFDINYSLDKGEILCIIGPSGSGKTRMLRAIGGFVKIDSAIIELDNENITSIEPENRGVATVFQTYDLFPHMNVIENVTYGLDPKQFSESERNQIGSEMLKRVGLAGFEARDSQQLSGGEQQRVAIARALAVKPKLLLLDEPFSNLDPKRRLSMRQEIKDYQNQTGTTIIYVTHNLEEAFAVADKIIVMNEGKIQQFGTPDEIINMPANDFVREFVTK